MPRITSVTQRQLTTTAPDQTLDQVLLRPTFDSGTGFGSTVDAIALQSDGKILAGGSFTSYDGVTQNRITRLNADGTRDTAFDSGSGFNNRVYTITIQSDGKILVGGIFTSYDGVTQNRITRLNADGTRDTGFTIGTGFNDEVYAIAVQSDGKILVGGLFSTYDGGSGFLFTRLNTDGSRDTGFTSAISNGPVNAIAVQSDGKIVAGGNFDLVGGVQHKRITRLNADGTRDTGFIVGTGFDGSPEAIALQPDGKILVGGVFTAYDGLSFTQERITRLNTDGTRDTGFTIGTGFAWPGNIVIVRAIALQPDGRILVGGGFTSYDGVTQNRITRLNADGTRDTGFSIGTGFSFTVYAIALQSDGKILVGGQFTSYNSETQNRIAALNGQDGLLLAVVLPVVSYAVSGAANNVDESSALTINITTANISNGTVLGWRILDRPEDFDVNTGLVTVSSNAGSFTVTPTADLQTEGVETFRVQLEKTTGTIVGVTSAVTINDTSLSP